MQMQLAFRNLLNEFVKWIHYDKIGTMGTFDKPPELPRLIIEEPFGWGQGTSISRTPIM
jgi:hypothetical protein